MLIIAVGCQSCSQNSENDNVPTAVISAFNQKFPTAQDAEWEMEDETEWEAEFKLNDIEYSANFSINGEWKETEHEIIESEIPSDIRSLLDQRFTDYIVEEAEISESPTRKSFEFEIEIGEDKFEVVIDANGRLTQKTDNQEDKENDED